MLCNDQNSIGSFLVLKPSENLTKIFNPFNDFSSDQKENSDKMRTWKYCNIDEIQSLNKLNDKYSRSLLHINAWSLSRIIEDLQFLLDSTQICFDVIAIPETRIVKNIFTVNDINLTNYNYKYCPTESSTGVTLLYIGNNLSYKPRNDLCI